MTELPRLGALVLLVSASAAHATPAADLDRGRSSFRARDYQSAIPVLNTLLYPRPVLSQTADLVEAHLLLGGSLFEAGDRERAREEFARALQLEPERLISTLQYSEGAVKMFDEVKAELAAKAREDAERRRIADAQAQLEAYKNSLVVYEARPYYQNFLPFGLAQFTQGRKLAGSLFLAGQASTAVVSAGIYLNLIGTYGFNGTVDRADARSVRRMQQIQIGTGIAFVALYAYGVVDAIQHYKPRLRVEGDDSLIPQELRNTDKQTSEPRKRKKVSFLRRLQVAPLIAEDARGDMSMGLGLAWEND